jgi:hypothetical protein
MAMALIMGVASPYWMKAINPAVSRTLPAVTHAVGQMNADSHTGTANGLQK